MKIIDAHFHMFPEMEEDLIGELTAPGQRPGFAALREQYAGHDFIHGIMMSNGPTAPDPDRVPNGFHYCIGLDDFELDPEMIANSLDDLEANLQLEKCCGIKLYPGYNAVPIGSRAYEPVYELAAAYDRPVAFHMGQTALPQALLRVAHPLALDEVAVRHPGVQFVMCHFGNPFLPDAAAVVEKNANVAADLSGLLDGLTDLDAYFEEQAGYVMMLRGWISYVNDWSRFLFGTDYPAADPGNYVDFIARLVPERYHDEVFFKNANRIYRLGLR